MKKEKIAISIDPPTREMVDAMVDGLTIRSRSQAIEYLIAKGIEHQYIKTAVILIHANELGTLLKIVDKKPLIMQHLDWLAMHGVQNAFLVSGKSDLLEEVEKITQGRTPKLTIVREDRQTGTVPALLLLKKELNKNFIVMLGDTLNLFDLTKMILFHLHNDKIATVGLISSATPQRYSAVELEGDTIVEFRKETSESHIIDAGIYIFKPSIFKHLSGTKYFEKEVLPKLCHTNEIKGYFTHGKYVHFGEK